MPDLPDRLKAALADRYRVEREIGRGGMATVYLATDRKHNRQVAVKVLRPELAQSLGSERFLREIQITARLNHPHVLPLHDSGEVDGYLYYVMPYVQGESLRDRLRREKQLPVDDALTIAREVADAIGHAHSYGIVHRDLKPENILLSGGHAVVADFGIARAMAAAGGDALTETGLAIGTPTYMSPEQATGADDIDGRTDVYSLGCVLYEMLAGEAPYSGPSAAAIVAKKLSEPLPRVTVVRETVPPHVESAIERSLAKAPADRFATAQQFGDALAAQASGSGRSVAAPRQRTRRLVVGAGAVALLATAAIIGTQLRPGRGGAAPDPRLLAVAPFDVLGADIEMWGEGVAEIVAQQLDGAGPLRTIPTSAVRRTWHGPADPAAAARLGTRLGAGLAVYGRLVAFSSDSVRVDATLLDVTSGAPISHVALSERSDRLVALADALAAHFMADLSRERSLGSVALQSLGSSSPQAIAAFLRGEAFYRRYLMDSAAIAYREAIAIDDGFALAHNRLGSIEEWTVSEERAATLYFRAAVLNHGLAVRESLVIAADSLYAATHLAPRGPPSLPLIQRLFSTLRTADLVYGNDVGIRYRIAEARIHLGWAVGISAEETLDAFKRTVDLDSAFSEAWIHLIPLTFWLEGIGPGRDAIRAFLARFPASDANAYYALTAALVDARDDRATTNALLDTADAEPLRGVRTYLGRLRDSTELAVQLTQHPRLSATVWPLAYRGHLRAAWARLGMPRNPNTVQAILLADLAAFQAVAQDSLRAALDTWPPLGETGPVPYEFLAWWAGNRDTVAIRAAISAWESLSRSDTTSATTRAWIPMWLGSGRAWLALARGDTVQALGLFDAASAYRCFRCYRERLAYARLLAADGRDREAADALRGSPTELWRLLHPGEIFWALERARVNERLGNTERAIQDYRLVAAVWINADAVLQPFVEESHEALRRLTGEQPQ